MGTNINYVGTLMQEPKSAYARVIREVNTRSLKTLFRIQNVDFDVLPERLGNFKGKTRCTMYNL